jgi:hypothetical protein
MIQLLDWYNLLAKLKDEVTLEANEHMPILSGVPPHVNLKVVIKDVLSACVDTQSTVQDLGHAMKEQLKDSIFKAIDKKVKRNSVVNGAILAGAMQNLKRQIFEKLDQMSEIKHVIPTIPDMPIVEEDVNLAGPFSFSYKGSAWCVPESFQFPARATRQVGWRKWLKGAVHVDGDSKWLIKPYRKFIGKELPSEILSNQLQSEWRPIFCKMMETPGLDIPPNVSDIDKEFLETSYRLATDYLQNCVSYIFNAPTAIVADYSITTWSRKLRWMTILGHGTQEDIVRL